MLPISLSHFRLFVFKMVGGRHTAERAKRKDISLSSSGKSCECIDSLNSMSTKSTDLDISADLDELHVSVKDFDPELNICSEHSPPCKVENCVLYQCTELFKWFLLRVNDKGSKVCREIGNNYSYNLEYNFRNPYSTGGSLVVDKANRVEANFSDFGEISVQEGEFVEIIRVNYPAEMWAVYSRPFENVKCQIFEYSELPEIFCLPEPVGNTLRTGKIPTVWRYHSTVDYKNLHKVVSASEILCIRPYEERVKNLISQQRFPLDLKKLMAGIKSNKRNYTLQDTFLSFHWHLFGKQIRQKYPHVAMNKLYYIEDELLDKKFRRQKLSFAKNDIYANECILYKAMSAGTGISRDICDSFLNQVEDNDLSFSTNLSIALCFAENIVKGESKQGVLVVKAVLGNIEKNGVDEEAVNTQTDDQREPTEMRLKSTAQFLPLFLMELKL